MPKRILYGFLEWFLPSSDSIRGRITQKEREQALQLGFFVYIAAFSLIRKFIYEEEAKNAPLYAAILGFIAYTALLLFRLGQGDPADIHRRRILLVEDDPQLSEIIVRLLRSGWDVVSVASVAEALRFLHNDFCWVLLDLVLPDGDGDTLLRVIRERNLRVKIIIMTGLVGGPTKDATLNLKPDVWLEKPIDPDRLLQLLDSN
jgi:CheY-like chemotaxis protein